MNLLEFLDDEEIRNEIDKEKDTFQAKVTDKDADDILARIIWADRKIKENDEKVKQKKAELQGMLEAYDKRLSGSLREYASYQKALLYGYLMQKLDGKKGTVKLFHGNIRLKAPTESVEFSNEEGLITWLKANGYSAMIKVKESIGKTDIKNEFQKDKTGEFFVDKEGNIIQGVHIKKSSEGLEFAYTATKATSSPAPEIHEGVA